MMVGEEATMTTDVQHGPHRRAPCRSAEPIR
jgi:hypothetical protein